MPTQQQPRYSFVRRAALRHWKKGAAVGGAACLVALIGMLWMPQTYYSEARLLVRFGPPNQVDPTTAGAPMIALGELHEREINSLIEILRSQAILDRVVSELGPQYVLYGHKSQPSPLASTPGAPPSWPHQQAVRALEKTVVISAPRRSNIITVIGKARSPELAQQIVAKLVAVYLEEHVRVHRTPGSSEFFVEQARVSKAAWQAAADRLAAAKNRLNSVTIDGKRKELETQLGDTANRLLANQSELTTSAGKIAALQTQIAAPPETIATHEAASPSASIESLRQSLSLLQSQEKELAAKMRDSHPKLAYVRQQIADLRKILDQQPVAPKAANEALHPARQSPELTTEQLQADALRARERSLIQQQQELRGALARLNASALEIEQLQQQVTLAESNHRDCALRLEQARINRSLDDEQISNLSLVQPASFVAQASCPPRSYVLAGGLLLAAAMSVGTVLLAAWLNPIVTTAEQLTAVMDLPLVGMIPKHLLRAA